MHKSIIALTLSLIFIFTGCNQSPTNKLLDENAISTLDEMTATIGDLSTCSLTVIAEIKKHEGEELVITNRIADVYFKGNNRMHVYSENDQKRRGLWYSDSELAWYDFDAMTYDVVAAPATTIQTIDSISRTFDVEFPAADVFYPTLTDDLIENFDTVVVVRNREFEGKSCLEINATNTILDVYLLVDQASHLPVQLMIYSIDNSDESYVATYSNWRLNPNLPDDIFEFTPPENATKTSFFNRK